MQHPAFVDRSVYCGVVLVGNCRHDVVHGLTGAALVDSGAWSVIQQVGDGVQVFLAVERHVGAFGQELSQQSVGVLAGTALPGTARIADAHAHVGLACQLSAPGHLTSSVVGQCLAKGRTELAQLGGKVGRAGRRVRHARHQQARAALDQHTHRGFVASSLEQVAFPVAWHQPVIDFGRAHVDAHLLGQPASPALARQARLACAAALAQAGQQRLAQFAFGVHLDGVVDRLLRDVQFASRNPHALECPRDLLRRPISAQRVGSPAVATGHRHKAWLPGALPGGVPYALAAPPSTRIPRADDCAPTPGSGSPRCAAARFLCSASATLESSASAVSPASQAAATGIF